MEVEELSGKTPDALAKMPKLLFHQGYYFDIFQTLSEWRREGPTGGASRLTLADIVSYCDLMKIESLEARQTILYHIKRLDRIYLQQADRLAEQMGKKPDTDTNFGVK